VNFYKHHLGDYDGATAHLSWEEDLAYTRLLRAYYRREKPIPANPAETYRLVRALTATQKRAVTTVLHEFFVEQEDGWHNKRADEEITAYQAQADTNRRIARERIVPRTVQRTVHDSSTKRIPNQEPEPLTINQEPKKERKQPVAALPDWLPEEPWNAWLEVRQKIKAPNTARALSIALKALDDLRGKGFDPSAVLENCTMRGWRGIYPPSKGTEPDYAAVQRQIEEEERSSAKH
jgi:uncharacterized protein YdaU (DUF1376 family)